MDAIIPEDISYFHFLTDKSQGLLLDSTENHAPTVESVPLNTEPVFTEYIDGNTTWTIGGVPIYFNGPVITEGEEQQQKQEVENVVETDNINNRIENIDSSESIGFPIEIPGKGFLTSSGLFVSNEVLLHLNLQNGTEEVAQKSTPVEILSQHIIKKDENIDNKNAIAVDHQNKLQEKVEEKQPNLNNYIEIVSVHKCKNCSALFERYDDIVKHIQKSCEKVMRSITPKVQKMSSLINKDENKKPVVKDIFLCGMCENVGCENLENLKKHMLAKHNLTYTVEAETDIRKEIQPKSNKIYFQNIVNKLQNDGRRVKCLVKGCDSRFSRMELMMRHHECHFNGEKKQFKCPECDKMFFIWRLCSAHMWKCHKIDIGLYSCNFCNVFKSLSPHNLLIHMSTHDSEQYKPFLCAVCGQDFKQFSHLKNHETIHTENGELSTWISKIKCATCNRIFSNTKVLKKHIQAVHNKFKPFICNICGHQCARKAMLDLHIRQHTGEKPYKCVMCEYKTGDHNSLRRHINRHYGTTNYSCKHCEYQTIQSIALKTHLKKKHPGQDGLFSCLVCSYDTVNEKMYNEHLKEHTMGLLNGGPIRIETINKIDNSEEKQKVPNIEDEETQPELFSSDLIEDMAVDTGGITIPAGSEIHV